LICQSTVLDVPYEAQLEPAHDRTPLLVARRVTGSGDAQLLILTLEVAPPDEGQRV
jgi:hypothetical protein